MNIKEKVLEISDYIPKDKSGAPLAPIDLSLLLEKYNLKAYNVNFTKPGISGAFDRNKKTIYIDATDPRPRKMFTLAHELGHYFLHKDLSYDILYREKDNHDKIEHEANEFAAELLMPERTIMIYWTVTESIQQLADIFSVSYLAMKCRLHKLGLI